MDTVPATAASMVRQRIRRTTWDIVRPGGWVIRRVLPHTRAPAVRLCAVIPVVVPAVAVRVPAVPVAALVVRSRAAA